jgi:hypothetical protein
MNLRPIVTRESRMAATVGWACDKFSQTLVANQPVTARGQDACQDMNAKKIGRFFET